MQNHSTHDRFLGQIRACMTQEEIDSYLLTDSRPEIFWSLSSVLESVKADIPLALLTPEGDPEKTKILYGLGESRERLYEEKLHLEAEGYRYFLDYDPVGAGGFVLIASQEDFSEEVYLWYQSRVERPNLDLFLEHPWFRKNHFPIVSEDAIDQDYELIEEVREVELDLLRKLVEVCKKHDLRIYPIYGTLLGLMRDGGVIPRDDDIDLAMPRADYDKLLTLVSEFDGQYFLQSATGDDHCFYGGYAKLRNSTTTALHPQNWFVDCNEGISIDIFPIDYALPDMRKEKARCKRIRRWQRFIYAKHYGFFRDFKDMPMLTWKAYKYLGMKTPLEKFEQRLYQEFTRGGIYGDKHDVKSCDGTKIGDKTARLAIYTHYMMCGPEFNLPYMEEEDFATTFSFSFEGIELQVPLAWEKLLRMRYGDQYDEAISFWPEKKRHGFYDVHEAYTVTKERFAGLKDPASIDKPVFLLGDGSLFRRTIELYEGRVNFAGLVLLPEEKPEVYGLGMEAGEDFCGIPVLKFEDFFNQKMDCRLVITSGDMRRAERCVKEAGITDYYFFWYNREWMLYANQSQIWNEIFIR